MESEEGFTLVEILMCVTLMSITAGVMTLSFHAAEQTPKREAEKIAAYFTRLMQKADRIKVCFDAEIIDNALNVFWNKNRDYLETPFEISAGLKYIPHFNTKDLSETGVTTLTYDRQNYPNGAKIFATGNISSYNINCKGHRYIAITADNSPSSYYVLITDKDTEEQ